LYTPKSTVEKKITFSSTLHRRINSTFIVETLSTQPMCNLLHLITVSLKAAGLPHDYRRTPQPVHDVQYKINNQQGCRGDGISIPIPTPYPYPWGSPMGIPISTAESRAAVGTELTSPYPPHTHTHGNPHGDPHTHGRPDNQLIKQQLLATRSSVVEVQSPTLYGPKPYEPVIR